MSDWVPVQRFRLMLPNGSKTNPLGEVMKRAGIRDHDELVERVANLGLPSRTVTLKPRETLYASQPRVHKAKVARIPLRTGSAPLVLKLGDRQIIIDGHHRICKARARSVNMEVTQLEGDLLDIEKASQVQVRSYTRHGKKVRQHVRGGGAKAALGAMGGAIAGEAAALGSQIAKAARKAEPDITKTLVGIAKGGATSTAAQMIGLDFRLKSESGLQEKVDRKMAEKGLTAREAAAGIADAVRYTMQSSEASLASDTKATFRALAAAGHTVLEVQNSWTPGSPYKGVNSQVRDPRGVIYELQFHTAKSWDTKDRLNHKMYEEMRSKGTSPQRKQVLGKQMADNAAKIPEPAGITSIQSYP